MPIKYLFLLLLFGTPLFSKNLIISTESIEKFFDNNFSKQACKMSLTQVEKNPENFKAHLHVGQCALNRGDIDAAMAAFDRAGILKEDNFLVHKCLGDMHSKIGNFMLARRAYDKADIFSSTPVKRIPVVNKNPHKFNFQLHLYRGFDDNIKLLGNISDVNNQFAFAVNSADLLSDWFTKEYFSMEHLYKQNMSSFYYYKSTLEILNKNHDTYNKDDLIYEFVKTGPAWGDSKFDIWIPFEYTRASIDYEAYSESFSLNPQLTTPVSNSLFLILGLRYEYVKSLRVDLDSYSLSSASLFLNKNFDEHIIKAGYRYLLANNISSENKQLFINHFYNEYNLAYTWNFSQNFGLNLDFTYRRSSYDDVISDTSVERRSDSLMQYRTSLTYNINDNFSLITEYIRYTNHTNFISYDYVQNIMSFGIRSYF